MKIDSRPIHNSFWTMRNQKDTNTKDNNLIQVNKVQSEISKMILSSDVASAINSQSNSINIQPGEVKNIGNVHGSPLNISFDSYGMNTSFGIAINANDPIDSPRTQLALEVFNKYTSSQRGKAGSISSRFGLLYQVANGSMSVDQYNATDLGQSTLPTSELLTSLGIDITKPFTFNGTAFSLDSQGNLSSFISKPNIF